MAPVSSGVEDELSATGSVHLVIPALPLQQALDMFGARTGWSGLYLSSTTNNLWSTPLSGWYTPSQALRILLLGTGLRAHFTAANAFVLEQSDFDGAATDTRVLGYDAVLQRGIRDAFCGDPFLAVRDFRAAIRLYVNTQGRIHRVDLLDTTGDARRDQAIVAALRGTHLAEVPADTQRPFFILLLPQSGSLDGCQSE
ncbi:hypothetical protein GCM10007205_00940 [Oxalicibacterium flavum]|uniref:Secretin/TonB short N-terminal domain-containing protein n=1 Tax=Oxalicibacterium flavum TaxID=179467 RepID=A0A8J2XX41_9BURK|nr:STN domain-containing protein [Oxalicibacterium flavum]GGB95529.1 hypothetical protein GCM10007205_00940 [Oxalicibacterium flavum]